MLADSLQQPYNPFFRSDDPRWEHNDMGWNIVPDGLRKMLLWVSRRYHNPLVYITENGSAEAEPNLETARHDEKRRSFFESHLFASALAIQSGSNCRGYFAWSLLDNFEWQFGYQRRFGICRVDYETLERTVKSSALWYRNTIQENGRNIQRRGPEELSAVESGEKRQRSLYPIHESERQGRGLPDKVLIGYGSDCDAVRRAVADGVNVVIWSFLDVRTVDPSPDSQGDAIISTNLNLPRIRALRVELDQVGYGDVLHFASVGGWNGAHLDPKLSATEWYQTFNESVGDLFQGIDWDLEGNDQMNSPYNFFTLDCLDKIGEISRMAKEGKKVVWERVHWEWFPPWLHRLT